MSETSVQDVALFAGLGASAYAVLASAAALPAAYASRRFRDGSESVSRRGVAWFGGLFLALVALVAAATVAADALGLFDSATGTVLVTAVLSLVGPFSVTRFPRFVSRRYDEG